MSRNPYTDLCLTVQALRREFEGLRTPLAPALGVAASIYTHQIANVFRVLTDVRVRHLLADEVGLGKTVQALMILNALRYYRPGLRALVIVPDRLVTQWRDEILARAHEAPTEQETAEEGQYIRLAWEAQLKKTGKDGRPHWALRDIDPLRYQVLVVDELHSLRSDVQDRIVRVAAEFDHLLALTATPAFQDPARHAQLFALLEPERSFVARRRTDRAQPDTADEAPGDDDSWRWTEHTARAMIDVMLGKDSTVASSLAAGEEEEEVSALAHCVYRRVIRARRAEYGGLLPRRRHVPLLVEPLDAEAARQSLMWRYFSHFHTIGRRVDPVRLAKRVIVSPPSLRQRVDFLRRSGDDRENLLERVKPLVEDSRGDSRADALIDLLADIWTREPMERVLVAAQDNLTVDYLFDLVKARLPVIGPLPRRVSLVAARIRQGMMTEAVDDLAGYGNETVENLEAFQRGKAHVLFAPEVVREGLNLQCSRILVLYSVPWQPSEVEQWIGRLDRIGNLAAFPSDGGEVGTVDIFTIAQKGLVDEKVVDVLQCFRTFERSVNLDGNHLEEIARRIEDAALRPERANWRGLEEDSEAMAAEDEVQELESALRPYLPWTKHWATRVREYLESLPPAPLNLLSSRHSTTGPRSWDRGVEGMVGLLKKAKEYHIRLHKQSDVGSFRTLWYRFEDAFGPGQRNVFSKVKFSFGADPGHERHPKHAHAFITRRGDIGSPPHRSATMFLEGWEYRRPLRFLNFGNSLHDELFRGWLPDSRTVVYVDVQLPDGHAFFRHSEVGVHVLRFSILDPAWALEEAAVNRDVMAGVVKGIKASALPPEQVCRFERAIQCAIEADIRWLRGQLPAALHVKGASYTAGRWTPARIDAIAALLNPLAHGPHGAIPRSFDWRPQEKHRHVLDGRIRELRAADSTVAAACWSDRFSAFERALATRRGVVTEERRDAQERAGLALYEAESRFRIAQDQGHRGQITRTDNRRREATASAEVTSMIWEARDAWLENCAAAIRATRPRECLVAALRVQHKTWP